MIVSILCEHQGRHEQTPLPEAVAIVRHPFMGDFALCRGCLNDVFDYCDNYPDREPTAIAWRRTLGELSTHPDRGA